MTPIELANFRDILEATQVELEGLLRNRKGIAVESSADILDQVQHASERDIAIGNLERESDRLREVRSALRRIHFGTFGICLDCEGEISMKRLAAVPWTTSCLVCQSLRITVGYCPTIRLGTAPKQSLSMASAYVAPAQQKDRLHAALRG
jgi:DnaK suppressor protein